MEKNALLKMMALVMRNCVSDSGGPSEASDGEKDDDVTDGEGVDA